MPISVTGRECALDCLHCSGNYLKGRQNVRELVGIERAPSYLITGGCDSEGKVPILQHLDALRSLPATSIKIAHTGLVDEHEVEGISDIIDVASFDFVGDDKTIEEIYGLKKSVVDYASSYSSLSSHIPTFPHLTVGLYRGRLAGEFAALDILSQQGTSSLVINVLIPTAGTQLGHLPPPPLEDVRRVIREARGSFRNLYVGCMRPGGHYRNEVDVMALEESVDRIVNPAKPARELAAKLGLDVEWREECCIL
jgi:uncharacterized radical SAM superfamily protein